MMSLLRRLFRSTSGGIAIMTAVLLPILLGMTALGVEVGHWYLTGRVMQGAADSAAMSAAAEYIAQGLTGSSYQTVGKNYSKLNGFEDTKNNVTVTICGPSDNRLICQTDASTIKAVIHQVQSVLLLPTNFLGLHVTEPNIGASAAVSLTTVTVTNAGNGCVLAVANALNAVQVRGTGVLKANCGIFVDGGIRQTDPTPQCSPSSTSPCGDIHFTGAPSQAWITSLQVAASSGLTTLGASANGCPVPPDASKPHCFLFNGTTFLPSSAIKTSTGTPDPYASLAFLTPPLGVNAITVTNNAGGYNNGLDTFTLVGGTFTFPAKFTATVSGGKITGVPTIVDPGAYTVLPTGPVSVTTTGPGSGAKITLTEGCFTYVAGTVPLPGRKYCSFNLVGGTTNFATGNYFIAGGDVNCIGFCVAGANTTVTSDSAGVTFYLTNGEGSGTFGTSSYARLSISSAKNITLCAPGTACGTTCTGTCVLFFQNPAATSTTSLDQSGAGPTPANTNNTFSGNGTETFSGLLYLPKQTVSLTGGADIKGCAGVVAKYLDVAGTPSFSNGCLPGRGIGGGTTTTTTFRLSQ
jgi:hypothetical protein